MVLGQTFLSIIYAPQKVSMAKSETVNIIILCQYSTLIMNKSLTNIITNLKIQILIKKLKL